MSKETPKSDITCSPERIPVKRSSGPAKPKTQWVMQMGPFTDGQITSPDSLENVSGPFTFTLDPQTGEMKPLDPDEKPAKNVIRKYITVEAQDTDVPNDLAKVGTPMYVERTNSDLIDFDTSEQVNNITKVSYVREDYGTQTVQCNDNDTPSTPQDDPTPTPAPTQTPTEAPTPAPTDAPTPTPTDTPTEAPTPTPTDSPTPTPTEAPTESPTPAPTEAPTEAPTPAPTEAPPEVEAKDDCFIIEKDETTILDVLENDKGEGLFVSEARADNGSIEIIDGQIHYTPLDGSTDPDTVYYTVTDSSGNTSQAEALIGFGNETTQVSLSLEEFGLSVGIPIDGREVDPSDTTVDEFIEELESYVGGLVEAQKNYLFDRLFPNSEEIQTSSMDQTETSNHWAAGINDLGASNIAGAEASLAAEPGSELT